MGGRYDLVVIGSGTAGLLAASTTAKLGGRVAIVERDAVGGDCTNTGCIPSKTLLASAARAQEMRNAGDLGVAPVEPQVDFAAVMRRIEDNIATTTALDHELIEECELIEGEASFTSPAAIEVGGRELRFRKALIATGTSPMLPPLNGLEGADPLTNESVFSLRECPERLLVIGGGAIGCELGQAFARLGSEVTIVEQAERLLPREDPEAAGIVAEALRGEGVSVVTGDGGRSVAAGGGAGVLTLAGAGEVEFDRVLIATGRRAVTQGLGLERAGVELDDGGFISVNKRLRTSARHIYAAGDVTGGELFTHAAGLEGLLAVGTAMFRAPLNSRSYTIPRVTFTDPELAQVGLTEAEARESSRGEPVALRWELAELDRSITDQRTDGFVKLIAGRRGKLLGMTAVGAGAGEMIAAAGLVIEKGRKVSELLSMVNAYPTLAEAAPRAASGWYERTYLEGRSQRLLAAILRGLGRIDRPRS